MDIERQQPAALIGRGRRLADHDRPSFAGGFVVTVAQGDAREVEDRETAFAGGQTGAAPAHLLVEDRAVGEAGHHQIADFRAVEPGVEHVHADQDLRVFLVP